MALNISVPLYDILDGFGFLTPDYEKSKLSISPIESESSGISSLDSDDIKKQLLSSSPTISTNSNDDDNESLLKNENEKDTDAGEKIHEESDTDEAHETGNDSDDKVGDTESESGKEESEKESRPSPYKGLRITISKEKIIDEISLGPDNIIKETIKTMITDDESAKDESEEESEISVEPTIFSSDEDFEEEKVKEEEKAKEEEKEKEEEPAKEQVIEEPKAEVEEEKRDAHADKPVTKDFKLMLGNRDLLDLGGHLRDSKFDLRYAELPENNLKMFFANRSQYHRLGANGERQEFSHEKCKCCDFYYPMIIFNNNNINNNNKNNQNANFCEMNPTTSSLIKNFVTSNNAQKSPTYPVAQNNHQQQPPTPQVQVMQPPTPQQQQQQVNAANPMVNGQNNNLTMNFNAFIKNITNMPETNVIQPPHVQQGPIAPIPITKKNSNMMMNYNNIQNGNGNGNINYFDAKSTKINNYNFGNNAFNQNQNGMAGQNAMINNNHANNFQQPNAATNATNAALALFNYMNRNANNNNLNMTNGTANTSRFPPTNNGNSNANVLASLFNQSQNNQQIGGMSGVGNSNNNINFNNQSNGNFQTLFGSGNTNSYGLYKQF